jgi:methylenetetrahydrofolate dehydrogenase (NADP+)/methenyltetrahydrofolate cyclohydrolase/formyltetrahydrofolate synthetase
MRDGIASRVAEIQKKHPRFKPHLAIIQQGARPDSSLYVRMKAKAAAEANIGFTHLILPEDASEEQVMKAVEELNADEKINGLLVQLPLSNSIGKAGERRITEAVSPKKDVDGFHAYNIGLLSSRASDPLFPPCTPAGAMVLLESTGIDIAGKHAVVLGRSDIVGSPVCAMLRRKDATVTQCHSRTSNLPDLVRDKPYLIRILLPIILRFDMSVGQASRHCSRCYRPARIRQG